MNAPARASTPPNDHAPKISHGVSTMRATTWGFMKIPEPTMPPMTSMTASKSPSRRANPAPPVPEGRGGWPFSPDSLRALNFLGFRDERVNISITGWKFKLPPACRIAKIFLYLYRTGSDGPPNRHIRQNSVDTDNAQS